MSNAISFSAAMASIAVLRERIAAGGTAANREAVQEIESRVTALAPQFHRLMELNERLLEAEAFKPIFATDPLTGALIIRMSNTDPGITVQPAVPGIPVAVVNSAHVSAYTSGIQDGDTEEVVALRRELETNLEQYYYSAHRVEDLVVELSGGKKRGTGVTIVRNKLIEHAPTGSIYSFGCSTNGPVIKPLQRGEAEWIDKGLMPNTIEFVELVVKLIDRAAANT